MLGGMVDVGLSGVAPVLIGAGVGACAGAGAGRLGFRVVRRLLRPARPRAVWCVCGVAAAWSVVAAGAAAGVLAPWWAPVPLLLGWLAVVLTVADLLTRRLPDAVTLPAYPVLFAALAVAAVVGRRPALLAAALLGATVFVACYGIVRMVVGDGLGGGDVKLAGSLGAAVGAVGPAAVLVVMGLAALGTAVAGGLRRTPVPHGPAMLIPAWIVTVTPGAVGAGGGAAEVFA